jgi:hypothetical protein
VSQLDSVITAAEALIESDSEAALADSRTADALEAIDADDDHDFEKADRDAEAHAQERDRQLAKALAAAAAANLADEWPPANRARDLAVAARTKLDEAQGLLSKADGSDHAPGLKEAIGRLAERLNRVDGLARE